MQDLPVELLQSIFMLLSPCTDLPTVLQVCKRWRNVGLEVMKLRKNAILSAYTLQAPLRWHCPKVNLPAPSKRFGATILQKDQYVYVFGGATSMFTTFNDLWRYELNNLTWKRLVPGGDLPTPRAHAKGGFVGDTLYLFGGCHSFHPPGLYHTGRMEWLSDLFSFDTHTCCWSKRSLRHVDGLIAEPPVPVTAGQTGCFLPAGGIGHPSVLVLFGGISRSMSECVNDVCLINPDQGQWMSLTAPLSSESQASWPAGRCGHSVCALDSTRMLVLFGNLQSPITQSNSPEPPLQRQRLPLEAELNSGDEATEAQSYHGQPAGDIWILTRTKPDPNSPDWSSVHWYWTKVTCPNPISGCPPLDFYHACTICLPWTTDMKSYFPQSTGSDSYESDFHKTPVSGTGHTFTVICISQSTRALLDEAVKQRRHWWHRARSSSDPRGKPGACSVSFSTCSTNSNVDCASSSHADAPYHHSGTSESVTVLPSPPESTPSAFASPGLENRTSTARNAISLPPSPRSLSGPIPASRRSAERRARQLEALAMQERRLFGSREVPCQGSSDSNSPNPVSPISSIQSESMCALLQSSPLRPLAAYTLRVNIPLEDEETKSVEAGTSDHTANGLWIVAKKPHFLDLVFGPAECLGFSCTFGHGCLFLFGGLCDSDEEVASHRQNVSPSFELPAYYDEDMRPIEPARLPDPNDLVGSLRAGVLTPMRTTLSKTSQFYVLQARSLVGTLL